MSSAQESKQDTSAVIGEESQKPDNETRQPSPPRIEAPSDAAADAKTSVAPGASSTTTAPLAPPPKPGQNTSGDGPDYFSGPHGGNHFNLEPNPFEQSFGNPSAETPGKSLLPPVASLTSPSSLLPGGTPGWPNSLRSGPLSPAMLAGPTGGGDYFGEPWKGGFPTPNESSLRTGLTPGGGGSMFPAPSPNSQALFNSLQGGGATPSTSEFYRTAFKMSNGFQGANPPTSQPAEQNSQPENSDKKPSQPIQQQDPFGQHDANVVTSLLGLSRADAQQNNSNSNNQFSMSGPPPVSAAMAPMSNHLTSQAQEPAAMKRGTKNSITSMSGSADTGDFSESAQSEDAKPSKSRAKKNTNGKGQAAGNRRKADDGAVKQPANKKSKPNEAPSIQDDSDDDDGAKHDSGDGAKGKDGKKMTDEEKRRNFLERNRVAALKCRQRKKQWLANLQAKVELFSTENDALSAQITQLREEIVNLKTMLLAHKDCPVSQAQGISGMAMANFIGDVNQHAHPYGMGMPPNGVPPMGMSMPQPPPPNSMQRR
ncbi:putative bZIP transcription factor [Phyllosticta citriasiana]|uniref:putative bZIP transcription factor n=1 Tax=Phyllosticta citriasiana TaxID=595635 RepID=UPI0030FD8779